jgi:hypothetical protein
VDQGVEQTPSVIPNGVDVLEEEREEGDREMVLWLEAWCEVRTGRTPGPSDVAEQRRRLCLCSVGP